jgi:hypothetical protein
MATTSALSNFELMVMLAIIRIGHDAYAFPYPKGGEA